MEAVQLDVVWNGAAEPVYAAARRAALQALIAEELATAVPTLPPPTDPETGALELEGAGDYLEALTRVLREGYPQAFSTYDVWRAIFGPDVAFNSRRVNDFSRARLTLEKQGRVKRVGWATPPSGRGRRGLTFRWVTDAEWTPPAPAETDPRSQAALLDRIRAVLFAAYPNALTHTELIKAIAPDDRGDHSLLRTMSKARLELEDDGVIERTTRHTSGPQPLRVRLHPSTYHAMTRRSA